jgi:tetratricopeptide (TPR) repeat protein
MLFLRSSLLVLILLHFSNSCFAQSNSNRLSVARLFFQQKKYEDVLRYLQGGKNLFKTENPELIYLSAASHYYLNHLEISEKEFISLLRTKSTLQVDALLYLGQIRFHQNDFTRASAYLKNYLKAIPPTHPNRDHVRNVIRNCATGLALQFKTPIATVENCGNQINASGDEFAPFWNPSNLNHIYFTAAKANPKPDERPQTDLYFSVKENEVWQKPKSLNPILNSPKQEVGFGFNTSGQVLYYFRGNTLLQGAVFTDTLKKTAKFKINPYLTSLPSLSAHNPPHFVSDSLIIFASGTLGGQGGLDLFKISRTLKGWSSPENLGPSINSAYDENYPFLSPDGTTLYFSSNNPEMSVGGYDILKSSLNKSFETVNPGIPLNSTADDTHFCAGRDGITAYFTSNRKTGFGARDLYTAYFYSPLPEMIAPKMIPGMALKDNLETDYLEFKSIVLNGGEHPLESDFKSYFNTLIPLLKEHPHLKIDISAYPHKNLNFNDGCRNSLDLLTDLSRFFSRASIKADQIRFCLGYTPLFEKGNVGISFRFSGELPMNQALTTVPLFEGENGNVAREGVCFKWMIRELSYAEIQNTDLESFKETDNLRLELVPKEEKIRIYGGLFPSFSLAQWSNNKNYRIVAFLDGEPLSKEKAAAFLLSYPVLADYIHP